MSCNNCSLHSLPPATPLWLDGDGGGEDCWQQIKDSDLPAVSFLLLLPLANLFCRFTSLRRIFSAKLLHCLFFASLPAGRLADRSLQCAGKHVKYIFLLPGGDTLQTFTSRAGHFRYFFIFSIIKNDFLSSYFDWEWAF